MKFILFCAATVAAIGLVAPAGAQGPLEELKKLPSTLPQGASPVVPTLRNVSFGAATHWVSPVLLNANDTIGGEVFTVNGKRITERFGFSVVNPNSAQQAHVRMECRTESGVLMGGYTSERTIAAMGAWNFDSKSVATQPGVPRGAVDADHVWCAIASDIKISVFGWTERRFGSDPERTRFSLEPAAGTD